jgi:hypothetical protein
MRYLFSLAMTAMLTGGLVGCGGGGDSGGGASAGAGAGSGSVSADAGNKTALADPRNGSYQVFEANGTQPTLAIDFDLMTYAMTDAAGGVHSGTFSAVAAEPGSYVFASSRITGVANTARFRVTTDGIVGNFPFAYANTNPVAYSPQPFVAARAFVTTAAQLDGKYNRFSAFRSLSGLDTRIESMKISSGGTTLLVCNSATLYEIDACPVGSQLSYNIVAGATPGRWEGVDPANPDPELRVVFYIAQIGGQNVYLRASYSGVTTTRFLRVGLPESANWPSYSGYSASTTASWGLTTISTTTYSRTRQIPDGSISTTTYPVGAILGAPLGIRSVHAAGPDRYFIQQAGPLSVMLGAAGDIHTAGNMVIGLN